MHDEDADVATRRESLVAPLLAALRLEGPERLVVRPHNVVLDTASERVTAHVVWTEDQHHTVLAALEVPWSLKPHLVVHRVDDTVVIEAWPPTLSSTAQLAERGELSALSAAFLSATLAMGRNILFTGPTSACLPLMAALVDEGQRPVQLASDSFSARPAGWHHALDLIQAQRLGGDRFAAWGLSARAMGRVMTSLSGVVGHLEAGRLDRVLMRFEAGWNRPHQGPLAVLAGLDVVVVVQPGHPPQVSEVAELALTEGGYRPLQLFARDAWPTPSALVPKAAPQFLRSLQAAGFYELAAALAAATRAAPTQTPAPESVAEPPLTSPITPPPDTQGPWFAAARQAARPQRLRQETPRPARAPIAARPPVRDSHPGWELDRLELPGTEEEAHALQDDESSEEAAGLLDTTRTQARSLTEEEATLAANFGLAPPPPPSGRAAAGVEPPAATGFEPDIPDELRHR